MKNQHYIKILAIAVILFNSAIKTDDAWAQSPTKGHLKAARMAIDALRVTESFDNILPKTAEKIKGVLIQTNPNFSEEISVTVDEEAIKLAKRRSDLEIEASQIYAKNFNQDELLIITEFYQTEAGKKLLQMGPNIKRELIRAADIWAGGIARDLDGASSKALTEKLNKKPAQSEN